MIQVLHSREKFKEAAKQGKVLIKKCKRCEHVMLETIYFCEKCYNSDFEELEVEGGGKVVTYTIQSVVPEGFGDAGSYAWVILKLNEVGIRLSGFLANIDNPSDLPINSSVKVVGFDNIHGLILEKTSQP